MKVKITLLEEVLGSSPSNEELLATYIASKAPTGDLTAASLCMSSTEDYKKQCKKNELHEAQLTGALHQVQMRRYDLKYGLPDSMIVKE